MNIPMELKAIPQWVVANSRQKIPFSSDGKPCSVNDKERFLTYTEASNIVNSDKNSFDCLGFVLTHDDPYCVIDLDNAIPNASEVQKQILDAFEFCYIERSVSKTGYHIVTKASCQNRRKQNVEIYSYSRYIIITGDNINNCPIIDGQKIVDSILEGMHLQDYSFIEMDLEDTIPTIDDQTVLQECTKSYGDKFISLYDGEWRLSYHTQSEADIMLIAILCKHSSSNGQVSRLFKNSKLGARSKASRQDYIRRTINRVRQNLLINKDTSDTTIEQLNYYLKDILNNDLTPEREIPELPNGIIKELTKFIMQSSVRPVYDISLVGAFGFFAGLIGRSFNISNTGLNLYLLLLAPTGTGKEQISYGIDKILDELRLKAPTIDSFSGPKGFASGQALLRAISKQPCMHCVFGEFGYLLQQLSDVKVNGNMLMFKRTLLDLYQKSGKHSILKPTAYADSEKNIPGVIAPNLTIIGEGTPTTFYDGMTDDMINDGLIPRFSIIEYKGDRVPRNRNIENVHLDDNTISALLKVIEIAQMNLANNEVVNVEIEDSAIRLLDAFDEVCDEQIRGSSEIQRQLWNRAHLKALKFSALLAVSLNAYKPIVLEEHASWAIKFVENEISNVLDKFIKGELGEENKYVFALKEIFIQYSKFTTQKRLNSGIPFSLVQYDTVLPGVYIIQKLRTKKLVKKDLLSNGMLKIILSEFVEQGILKEIPSETARTVYGYNGILYSVGPNFI